VTRDAFDGDEYNFGGRSIVNGGNHDQDLFIGSANQAQGTTIFDDQEEACSSLVGKSSRSASSASSATAVAPTNLMTDSLKHGTLLTWERSADASSYEIERASFSSITLGLKAPRRLPNGWTMEDATPTVTSPDAPGAVTVSLSVPGAFQPVGTTASSDFVDPRSGKYVYEVVAKSATGQRSSPSNVEVVPSAGAPATLSALRSALGIGIVSSAARLKSNAKVGVTTTSASPRLQRLLAAAETAVAHGDDAAASRDVAALQDAAGDNTAVAAIAARVVRRLEYARIAGQP
jgi:hypothetical protein